MRTEYISEEMEAIFESIGIPLKEILDSVGVPYNYYQFEAGEMDLPYTVFLLPESSNFGADNTVYSGAAKLNIELYTNFKDVVFEGKYEKAFKEHELYWDKYEGYIKSENMYGVVYGMEVIINV